MRRRDVHPRIFRAISLLAFGFCILAVFTIRLIYLQVIQYQDWAQRSTRNHVSKRVLDMKRGNIYDRNGIELAISVDTWTVYIFTRELKSLPETANLLATVLPMTREEIISKVGDRSGYIQIYKDLEPNLAMKIQKLAISGVNLESHYRRFYPQKYLSSNLIGFIGGEKRGLEGIELLYDKTLRGYPGLAVQEDISISKNGSAKMRIIRPSMGGSNLYLTIDSFIQHTLESELAVLFKKYDPIDATAIVMDPYSGDILGMAVLPNYDLNKFSETKPENRRNRPVTDVHEPGSCMKIFAVASGIENNKIGSGNRFYCRGYGEVNGRRIRCNGAHGLIDINEAIRQSCNTAMVQISQILEPAMLYRTYKMFGFGDATGIEAVGESAGMFKPPSRWSGFSAASMCIGQEMAATGIQLVTAYSAIANGGILLKPRLVKRIISPDSEIAQNFSKEEIRRVATPEAAKWLRKMLMGVVEGGSGRQVTLENHTVGGKTSTGQKANPKGGYFNDKLITSFIGMAPALEPRFVLLVEVNEPKGDSRRLFGGKVAGPAFSRIVDKLLKHFKVPPDRGITAFTREKQLIKLQELTKRSETIQPSNTFLQKNIDSATNTATLALKTKSIPDFRGKSMKMAMQIINELGIKAVFEGDGIVVKQIPNPGKPIPDSKIIILMLSSD